MPPKVLDIDYILCSLPDSLMYNVYRVVHTPHHPRPHGYAIKPDQSCTTHHLMAMTPVHLYQTKLYGLYELCGHVGQYVNLLSDQASSI